MENSIKKKTVDLEPLRTGQPAIYSSTSQDGVVKIA